MDFLASGRFSARRDILSQRGDIDAILGMAISCYYAFTIAQVGMTMQHDMTACKPMTEHFRASRACQCTSQQLYRAADRVSRDARDARHRESMMPRATSRR